VRIATVCTHNRTRSVMAMALLQAGLDARLGAGWAEVESFGFGPEGIAAIPDAVAAMKARGLDVSAHRSRQVTAERLGGVDLVLTAEKDHVVRIVGTSSELWARTFTLPEFLERAAGDPDPDGRSLEDWVVALSSGRTTGEYLRTSVPEVWDPTGSSSRRFAAAVEEIATACDGVVTAIAHAAAD
jgi:protein-tyrosine-phosphatase